MRDMSIEQKAELEQLGEAHGRTDAETLARIQVEARQLQGATLRRLIAQLFGRSAAARRPAHEDVMEQAFYRCHKRDAEVLRRIGASAARALSGRAVSGAMSEHSLKDIGLTRKDIDGFRSAPRLHNADVGSTAA